MTAPFGKRREAGVTLLELLIAVSLVSLLSVSMLMVLRVSLGGSQKAQDHISKNRRVLGVERILREQVSNLIPVLTMCRNNEQSAGQPLPLFEGRPASMRLVSSYSLAQAGRGIPHVLEYQVIPGEDGAGVRLVLNERPWSGPATRDLCMGVGHNPEGLPFARFPEIQVSTSSFVLADKLASCRLVFKELRRPPELERWVEEWTGADQWPAAIRIEMLPLVGDSSHLQLSTVTIPVRVVRDITREYSD